YEPLRRSSPNTSPEILIADRPSTSRTTVNTLSGSRPDPIGSVYLPSAPRFSPGTSELDSGCRIHVVQPSRSLPFQSGVHPFSAWIVTMPSNTTTRISLRASITHLDRWSL